MEIPVVLVAKHGGGARGGGFDFASLYEVGGL